MDESPDELSPIAGYAAWASCYDEDGNPLIPLEGPAVRELAGDLAGKTAIDLGAGTGRHARMLAEGGARVVALDRSPEMIAEGRRKLLGLPILWAIHALPAPLPIASGAIDLAILGLVAEHVPDLDACLSEVARVLKPGGLCILSGLHPDRTSSGQRARFIDPSTGLRRPIMTIARTERDYLAIADRAGLSLLETRSLAATPEMAELYPRSARYVGLNLAWVGSWRK